MTSALSTLGRGGPLGGVTVCFWGPLHLPQVTLTLSPSPSPSSSPSLTLTLSLTLHEGTEGVQLADGIAPKRRKKWLGIW